MKWGLVNVFSISRNEYYFDIAILLADSLIAISLIIIHGKGIDFNFFPAAQS